MCSISDEDGGEVNNMTSQEIGVFPLVTFCHKCGKGGEMYKLDFREAECERCFLQYVNHKFRATIGSSKSLPRHANILLAFDGSEQAMVLLDMLHKAHSETSFKKLHCELKLIFIDEFEFNIRPLNASDYIYSIQKVKSFILSYNNLKSYIINLGSDKNQLAFEIENIESYYARDKDKEKIFANNFHTIRNTTSRNEYLTVHRNKLIASVAQYLNCGYVFVPSICVNMATDLLSAIVLGRGNNASLDVAFVDDRLGNGIKLMRPIKDLSELEVLLYMRARNIKALKTTLDCGTIGFEGSLQGVTQLFIQNLQRNYPSTVSTIFRTGSKIAPSNYSGEESNHPMDSQKKEPGSCRLCNSLISIKSNTLLAVDYSCYVSEEASSLMNSHSDFKSNRTELLCYRCSNMQRDCDMNLMDIY